MPQDIPVWIDGQLRPMDKLEVHRRGLRHPAVSVFVLRGRSLLIQQRARGKYHTPGLWANTCCTHPNWGEAALDCARRRLVQELGLVLPDLHHRGTVEYRADVGHGMTEHEVVELFVGRVDSVRLAPDTAEVMATRWIDLALLDQEVSQRPEDFTPWLRIYLRDHASLLFG